MGTTYVKDTLFQLLIGALERPKEKWFYILFFTFFVPFFLLIFQPFGVNNYNPTHKIGLTFFLASAGFGLVSGLTLAIYEFLIVPYIFKSTSVPYFIIRILVSLLFVSLTLFFFYNLLGNFHDWSFNSLLGFTRDVSLMSIAPLLIIFLYFAYNRTRKAYQNLQIKPLPHHREELVWLEESNAKKPLGLRLNSLLFIEAQDNYVAVHHLENGVVKKTLLRTTMKKLETTLSGERLVRCHRSYLVNLMVVDKVRRSSPHHYLLYLSGISRPIPVSRSYIARLDAKLGVHHK